MLSVPVSDGDRYQPVCQDHVEDYRPVRSLSTVVHLVRTAIQTPRPPWCPSPFVVPSHIQPGFVTVLDASVAPVADRPVCTPFSTAAGDGRVIIPPQATSTRAN